MRIRTLIWILIVSLCSVGGSTLLTGDNNGKEKHNVKNFISCHEMKKNRQVQGYGMGEFYLADIDARNQLMIDIDEGYFVDQAIDVGNKRVRIIPSFEIAHRKTEDLKAAEVVFEAGRILTGDPLVFYIEDLGLQEGDKLMVRVLLEEKSADSKEWTTLSSNEMKFRIKKVGFKVHTNETVAFVRDSFSKNWNPQPGTSVTFGYTAYMTRKTPGLLRFFGKTWNLLDPRIGVNLTLLDFDKDKNMEIGLGPVISVMKGAFYFGVGWNFTTSRSKNQYAFFGISILEISEALRRVITR